MMFIINPGTGDIHGSNWCRARAAALLLAKEAGPGIQVRSLRTGDRGWFDFEFSRGKRKVEVSVPGVGPERLRDPNPWNNVRLYVDGSSWLWKFAVSQVRDALDPSPRDRE